MSLLQSNQFFEMQSALEHYNENRTTLKMTTGSADLDSLMDGIQEGMFYLFYGNNPVVLDAMVYRFLVNCVLPVKQKHGFESMGVFLNNVNYYDYSRKTEISKSSVPGMFLSFSFESDLSHTSIPYYRIK